MGLDLTETRLRNTAIVLFLAPFPLLIIWSLWVVVVTVATATHLPPAVPLRERSVLGSGISWAARVMWGTALLVISGVIGGFIAQQLDGISKSYAAATSSSSQASGNGAGTAAAGLQFEEVLYEWFAVWIAVFAAILVYALPLWLLWKLLRARTPTRRAALAAALVKVPDSKSKDRWLEHLSHWLYPVVFGFFAMPLLGTGVLLLGAWLVQSWHDGVLRGLNSAQ
ncbi:MFS family permease [Leifsonia sp. 563]|uniref:hypothetical protein n=1 Tax=Leifsonia sp. 563 TaxID=3156412 RepID=UPI003396A0A4